MSMLSKEYKRNLEDGKWRLEIRRASSMNPKPSEVLGVEGQEESVADQEKYSSEEWMNWMWETQVGAIQNPSIQCWICGAMGHMGRPSKGKGKGAG
eukprot:9425257-Karenia_brevis.AAC.1